MSDLAEQNNLREALFDFNFAERPELVIVGDPSQHLALRPQLDLDWLAMAMYAQGITPEAIASKKIILDYNTTGQKKVKNVTYSSPYGAWDIDRNVVIFMGNMLDDIQFAYREMEQAIEPLFAVLDENPTADAVHLLPGLIAKSLTPVNNNEGVMSLSQLPSDPTMDSLEMKTAVVVNSLMNPHTKTEDPTTQMASMHTATRTFVAMVRMVSFIRATVDHIDPQDPINHLFDGMFGEGFTQLFFNEANTKERNDQLRNLIHTKYLEMAQDVVRYNIALGIAHEAGHDIHEPLSAAERLKRYQNFMRLRRAAVIAVALPTTMFLMERIGNDFFNIDPSTGFETFVATNISYILSRALKPLMQREFRNRYSNEQAALASGAEWREYYMDGVAVAYQP